MLLARPYLLRAARLRKRNAPHVPVLLHFFKHGENITVLGSANIAPPLNDDPVAAAIFRDLHGLQSMITTGKAPRGRSSAVAARD
jgi:hypothetical protein